MQAFSRNLRFGFRLLTRNPGFTAVTLLTLALGIGANTAIFTVTSALLLRPFPYRDPQQLVGVTPRDSNGDRPSTLLRYELVCGANQSFQSVAVWANDNLNLTGSGEPIQVPIARVSPSFFSMLGIRPQLGRIFTEDEGRPEGKPVVMLTDSIWRSRFHADPNIVNQPLTLDGTPQTIVGVLPRDVQFPFVGEADIWTPRYFEFSLMSPQRLRMGVGYLNIMARLRPGTTLAQANAELALLNQRYREQNPSAPDSDPAMKMLSDPLRDVVVGDVRGKVLMLSAAVGLVLLIACANVASLLLSRALARKREIAVRTALGASRATLVWQLLTESMMLALVAGILGIGLSWMATRALLAWGASQLPPGIPIGMDYRVLLFTLVISIFAGIIFGTIPALQLARSDPNSSLRDQGRGLSVSRSHAQMKNLLVVSQVALSLLLVIGSGLLLRSFVRLLRVDPGFDARNVLTMDISLPTVKYSKPDQQIAFFDEVLRRVSALPGVRNAATSATLPLHFIRIAPVLPEGQPDVPLSQRPFVDVEAVSPQWFQTLRVPLRGGRDFTAADNAQAPKVVVINETFARQFWPNDNPIGKHMIVGRWTTPAEVVGVSADIKNNGLEPDTKPQIYLPFPQLPWGNMNLLIRTALPPRSITSAVRAQIAAVDPDQPVMKIQTVDDLMDASRSEPRFTMLLLSVFSATALVLAVIGIYGVLSYSVAQRRQEFGIRLALGAEHADILRLVVRHGLMLAAAGIVLGLIAALFLTRLMSSMLYKVGARDLTTFVLTPLLFASIAALASYLPARRATKVSPIEALR
ncbi:MAG TPA: ABC transporter permease [Candidatus Acidoferrales bacterium]|nr:ABC transporter permease [Candidatus Acidoferrales bacterium]